MKYSLMNWHCSDYYNVLRVGEHLLCYPSRSLMYPGMVLRSKDPIPNQTAAIYGFKIKVLH
jgi:hypothetical protein